MPWGLPSAGPNPSAPCPWPPCGRSSARWPLLHRRGPAASMRRPRPSAMCGEGRRTRRLWPVSPGTGASDVVAGPAPVAGVCQGARSNAGRCRPGRPRAPRPTACVGGGADELGRSRAVHGHSRGLVRHHRAGAAAPRPLAAPLPGGRAFARSAVGTSSRICSATSISSGVRIDVCGVRSICSSSACWTSGSRCPRMIGPAPRNQSR